MADPGSAVGRGSRADRGPRPRPHLRPIRQDRRPPDPVAYDPRVPAEYARRDLVGSGHRGPGCHHRDLVGSGPPGPVGSGPRGPAVSRGGPRRHVLHHPRRGTRRAVQRHPRSADRSRPRPLRRLPRRGTPQGGRRCPDRSPRRTRRGTRRAAQHLPRSVRRSRPPHRSRRGSRAGWASRSCRPQNPTRRTP